MPNDNKQNEVKEDPIREHTFDGIEEYDKKLPNWWLFTLYASIVFSFVYWIYYEQSGIGKSSEENLAIELARIETVKRASPSYVMGDTELWEMSWDKSVVSNGKATYIAFCVSCHGANLEGGIGLSLVDDTWVIGGNPTDIVKMVTDGSPAKGMMPWGTILGDKKISEVVAFILNHHEIPAEES
ncbi:MAG: c-type cytochrome [Opitutaceae bacterium]|nr:c-type cytochrome [Opitutaceae bacterium]